MGEALPNSNALPPDSGGTPTPAEQCPKGGEHRLKFNGGNPFCMKCGKYEGEGRVVLPATVKEDGSIVAHVPGDDDGA